MDQIIKEVFYNWVGANLWLFQQINAFSGQYGEYDHVMILISHLSESRDMFFPYLIVLSVFAIIRLSWAFIRKKPGFKYSFAKWLTIVVLFAASFPINASLNHFLKDYFAFPRPYYMMDPSQMQQLEVRAPEDARRSFPSGHTAFIACFIFSIWEVLSKSGRIAGLLAIVAVGWSRIALGVHFPADVLWSTVITLGVVCLVRIAVYTVLTTILRFRW